MAPAHVGAGVTIELWCSHVPGYTEKPLPTVPAKNMSRWTMWLSSSKWSTEDILLRPQPGPYSRPNGELPEGRQVGIAQRHAAESKPKIQHADGEWA